MTYRIMIVEDEDIIRKTLIESIDWLGMGCEVVCEAGDGREAIEYLQSEDSGVDVLLTDIKMDAVNGIELCKYVNENHPNIKIIILTAYNLFNYAQAALCYGVKYFLLKPIDYEELRARIRQLVSDIELERIKKQEFIRLQKFIECNKGDFIEKLFVRLVSNENLNMEEIEERIEYLGIERGKYCLISFDLKESIFKLGNERSNIIAACMLISSIIEEEIKLHGKCYCFFVDSMQPCYTFMPGDEIDRYELLEHIQERIRSITNGSFSAGISRWFENYADMREAYEQALSALQYKFYFGKDSILGYQDIITILDNKQKLRGVDTDKIIANLSVGNSEEGRRILDDYFEYLKSKKVPHLAYIEYQMLELAISIYAQLDLKQSNLYDMSRFNEIYKNILSYPTLDKLHGYLCDYINDIGEQMKSKLATGSRLVVDQIISFLREHYMENLCLNDLSRVVFMNPRYICKILKNETGKTYHEILTEIRIEKAKELLGNLQFRMYKIAEMVGFSDTRLFSLAFKKNVGVSATEYREMLQRS